MEKEIDFVKIAKNVVIKIQPRDYIENELINYLRKNNRTEDYIKSIISDETKKYSIWGYLKKGGEI